MISYTILYFSMFTPKIYDIKHDIIYNMWYHVSKYDIMLFLYMISYMISYIICDIIYQKMISCCSLAEANIPSAPRIAARNDGIDDCENDSGRQLEMDSDEQRDFGEQGMALEEDEQIFATLLNNISPCMSTADIEQLLQDVPVQAPVAVPVRTMQETVAAGDMPPLDVEAGNVF